jgi:glutaredoxin-like protein NrdH
MINITVYTLPNCVQCNQTKRELDKKGLTYNTVDLTTNEEAYNNITNNLGYKSAPVVIVTDETGETIEHWSGFQPEKLRGINE